MNSRSLASHLMKKFEISYDMQHRPVVHVPVGRSDEVLIPLNDWQRSEWRNAVLAHHPELDADAIDAAFAEVSA